MKSDDLQKLIRTHRSLALVEEEIYSVLPDTTKRHHYDTTAKFYDLFMSTRLYHAVMWGSSPAAYEAFSRETTASESDGVMLDAGCGSMLFTASSYVESSRKIICIDQSIGMLRKARSRLHKLAGNIPQNLALIQADLDDLPFLPGTFSTVLCPNVLHLYENAEDLMAQFRTLLVPNGTLMLTSLVRNQRSIGDLYANLLHRCGEFVRPRTADELSQIIEKVFETKLECKTEGNMAFISLIKKAK